MSTQRERLEAAAENLANANSTRSATGKPYQRRDVILTAQEIGEEWRQSFGEATIGSRSSGQGVKSEIVMADENDYITQYMPNHPDANAEGYVNLPNVEPLEETVNMMSAARSFEANSTVFNSAKEMARISINLGDA